jgi:hypothetical protein
VKKTGFMSSETDTIFSFQFVNPEEAGDDSQLSIKATCVGKCYCLDGAECDTYKPVEFEEAYFESECGQLCLVQQVCML